MNEIFELSADARYTYHGIESIAFDDENFIYVPTNVQSKD